MSGGAQRRSKLAWIQPFNNVLLLRRFLMTQMKTDFKRCLVFRRPSGRRGVAPLMRQVGPAGRVLAAYPCVLRSAPSAGVSMILRACCQAAVRAGLRSTRFAVLTHNAARTDAGPQQRSIVHKHKLKLDRGCLGEPLLRSVQYRHACDILDLLLLLLPAAASRHRCQLACRHFHTPAPRCPAATPCAVGLGSAPLALAPRCLASTRQHLGALYPPWRAGVWQLKQRAGGRCNFQGANGSCRQCTCQRL